MKWRTQVESVSYPFNINIDTEILMLGSCFAEQIGQKLNYLKIRTSINPSGISYNPVSLARLVKSAVSNATIPLSTLVNNGDKYVHFDFHGTMGHHDQKTCHDKLNTGLVTLKDTLTASDLVFITLGSAIVYELVENKSIVSNCHKFPQQQFSKRQLTTEEVNSSLTDIVQLILTHNPSTNIIFTISPIRHVRHGLIENNRSKATLTASTHSIVDTHDRVFYFPSYELLVDDLRDYRFYKSDLVHPTDSAVVYIWDYLQESFMNKSTINQLNSIQSLIDTYHHRSITTHTEKQIKELQSLKQKMFDHQLSDRFKGEIAGIEKRLATLSAS